ncbi:MAG TPA: mannose-1-phosphate guanylyltransferase [Candidatus Kapabacteria bacterium]|nr:mannose-1-phosphate guanylyltransferase [Candidatus Kapabacteria bacterium]
MKIKAVIMAGGFGTRFWPQSRERSPKQLLPILGAETMIQLTVQRLQPLVPPEDVIIVTNKMHTAQIREQLPAVPAQNIVEEPIGRNTAPCIALAGIILEHQEPDTVMVVLPADHLIQNVERFQQVVALGCELADKERALVTMGILPTRPETGYGYIQVGEQVSDKSSPAVIRRAVRFAEKPDVETAKRFLASGDFLWNSGMFIWRTDVILEQIKTHAPEIYNEIAPLKNLIGTQSFAPQLDNSYKLIRGISIDYAVMEKASNVFVAEGDFGWSDVGSWDEVANIRSKDELQNAIGGNVFLSDVKNSLVLSDGKLVAAIDVDDLIIINTDNAVLVCKRGSSQDVKKVVDYLRRKHMNEYL